MTATAPILERPSRQSAKHEKRALVKRFDEIRIESGFRDVVLINAACGFGENIVKGSVNPDEYCVFKPTLRAGFRPILQKIIESKEVKMIYDTGAAAVKNVPVPEADRARFALSDDDILQLARWACLIEEHYRKPMDVEWAKDGITGELFIVQARPETVQSRKDTEVHAAIVSRELGVPAVVGTQTGTDILRDGQRVTVSCADGDQGMVYEGELPFRVQRTGIVAPIFDERNQAVKKMIAEVIAVCRAKGRKIGICGQAPSDYPEFAQFLVEQGIDSVSLNPDSVLKTTMAILEQENDSTPG